MTLYDYKVKYCLTWKSLCLCRKEIVCLFLKVKYGSAILWENVSLVIKYILSIFFKLFLLCLRKDIGDTALYSFPTLALSLSYPHKHTHIHTPYTCQDDALQLEFWYPNLGALESAMCLKERCYILHSEGQDWINHWNVVGLPDWSTTYHNTVLSRWVCVENRHNKTLQELLYTREAEQKR